MQDRHRRIFQMTRLFIFVWSVMEENSPPLGGRVLCFPPGEDTRKGGGWGQGRGEGACGIVSGGSGGSLYQPCYCLCTSSRLELPLRGLSAFSPDNTQLCLTGDLRSVLVPPPGLHFKGKAQSKKLVHSTTAVTCLSAGAGKNETALFYKGYIRVKDYTNLSREQIVINLSRLR